MHYHNRKLDLHSSSILGWSSGGLIGWNICQELCYVACDDVVHLARGVQEVHPHPTGRRDSVMLSETIRIRVVHNARERFPGREEEHSGVLMLRGELRRFLAKQLVPELLTSAAALPCDLNRYALSCAWPQLHIRAYGHGGCCVPEGDRWTGGTSMNRKLRAPSSIRSSCSSNRVSKYRGTVSSVAYLINTSTVSILSLYATQLSLTRSR